MKVCFFCLYPSPYLGGSGALITGLNDCHCLADKISFIYVFPKPTNQLTAEWRNNLKQKGYSIIDSFSFSKLSLIKNALKIIKKEKPDVVHFYFCSNAAACVVARLISPKIKVFINEDNHQFPSKFKRALKRLITPKNVSFIAVSESLRMNFQEIYPRSIVRSLPNGLDFSKFDNQLSFSVYDFSGIVSRAPFKKILMFGFDYYRKGVDLALKALSSLNASSLEYVMVISLSSNFDEVKEKCIETLGCIPEWLQLRKADLKLPPYPSFDMFIAPSREEGFHLAVVEAAYCGLRIVASDIDVHKELNVSGKVLFASGDSSSLAQAIEASFSKNIDFDQQRQTLLETYSISRWRETLISFYMEK